MQNKDLIEKLIKLVTEERRIGVEILELIYEIERRKAYCDLGYDGLFSFCVKELRYSEAQATRRIQAMRAVYAYPELKEKIQEGTLTVTTVAQVQSHLKKQIQSGEIFTADQKKELFLSVENRSAKEVELKLQELSGGETSFTLNLKLNSELKEAWDKIKNLTAHSTHGQDAEVLTLLMKSWLEKNDPELKTERSNKTEKTTHVKNVAVQHNEPAQETRYISAAIKRIVWNRDQGKCALCKSRFAIQYDHLKSFAKKGGNDSENIRLLCRNCNLHKGIKEFGLEKMKRMNH